MDSVAVRDFRINPGKVWRRLSKSKRMIVTSTGRPIALLTNIRGSSLEDEIRVDALARGAAAVSKLRSHAQKLAIAGMKQKDIEKEILKSRKNR
jgi:antitoxin (DNA-binding transcriptional repressor) of toxin-antitoxin stability system